MRRQSERTEQAEIVKLLRHQAKRSPSDELWWQLNVTGSKGAVSEYRFDPVRKWRLDFAFPAVKLGVEVEGVVYPKKGSNDHRLGGRHVSVTGMDKDCEKYAALAIAGWRLIRVMPKHVTNGMALKWIEQALKS